MKSIASSKITILEVPGNDNGVDECFVTSKYFKNLNYKNSSKLSYIFWRHTGIVLRVKCQSTNSFGCLTMHKNCELPAATSKTLLTVMSQNANLQLIICSLWLYEKSVLFRWLFFYCFPITFRFPIAYRSTNIVLIFALNPNGLMDIFVCLFHPNNL